MFRLQLDKDNNRRGKNVNDINDWKEKTLRNEDCEKDDDVDDSWCSLGGGWLVPLAAPSLLLSGSSGH